MIDYSQGGEQFFLINFFKNKKDGVLIDIGAADGIANSNSRYFLENGWSGILIEPNKKNFNKLIKLYENQKNINLENCGCSNENIFNAKFFIDKNDEYEQISTFSEEQHISCKNYYGCEFVEDEVNLVKASDLFKKYNIKNIDFISIDTEGYDEKVIDGIDFNLVNIKLICVENINKECIEKLIHNGYELIYQTEGNKFYKKN